MAKFAGYGFNKWHAAAYALITYQTAYLKANYPVEFLAASMTLDLGNTDKLNVFRQELDRLGIKLLPPDINRSQRRVLGRGRPKSRRRRSAMRSPPSKGVGAQAMEALVARARRPTGRSRTSSISRGGSTPSRFNQRQFEILVKAGAFDSLDPNRAQTFAAAELLLRHASRRGRGARDGQVSLFGGIEPAASQRPSLPLIDDWPSVEKLQHEFDAIGFYLSSHPLDAYGRSLERVGILRWADLPAALAADGATRFRLAGIVVGRRSGLRRAATASRSSRCRTLSGVFELTLFSEMLNQARAPFDAGQPLPSPSMCAARRTPCG